MELDTHVYNSYIAALFAPQDEALESTIAEMVVVAEHPELTSIVIPILRQRGLDGLTVSVKS